MPHIFTPEDDDEIRELRAAGLTHHQTARTLGVPLYRVTARISHLELLARIPNAKVRVCIRPDCEQEFVSREFSHRVCGVCKHSEGKICEPFGNFPVVMA